MSPGALLIEAALKGQTDIADVLIAKGAAVDVRDASGATPLHLAALKGNVRIATLLLDHGAPVNALDNDGATPLHAPRWAVTKKWRPCCSIAARTAKRASGIRRHAAVPRGGLGTDDGGGAADRPRRRSSTPGTSPA